VCVACKLKEGHTTQDKIYIYVHQTTDMTRCPATEMR